jgi:hypothetical protein
MKVVLDECLPRRLRLELSGYDVRTVQEMGWSGISNGRLLSLAGQQFDVFLTVDRKLAFQQNLDALPMAVIVLRAPTSKIEDLRPLMPNLLAALAVIKRGELLILGHSTTF